MSQCLSRFTRPSSSRNPPDDTSACSLELRDDRRDVVVLFLKTESPNTIHDCVQQSLARQVPMSLKRFNQAPLAKFLSSLITGFGDAISVKRKHVPGRNSCSRIEQFHSLNSPSRVLVDSSRSTLPSLLTRRPDKWPQWTVRIRHSLGFHAVEDYSDRAQR